MSVLRSLNSTAPCSLARFPPLGMIPPASPHVDTYLRGFVYNTLSAAVASIKSPVRHPLSESAASCVSRSLSTFSHLAADTLRQWREGGLRCRQHGGPVHDAFCPICHIGVSDPEPPLVRLLIRLRALEFGFLTEISQVGTLGEREAAVAALVEVAAVENDRLLEIAHKVADGELGASVLARILELPSDLLQSIRRDLVQTLATGGTDVRIQLFRHLPEARWLSVPDAIQLAERALTDELPVVRNAALSALRALAEA
jgi:hypothetical protein